METPDDAGPVKPAENDARIAAIVAGARRTRTPIPRALWIAAIAIGAVCAVAFIVMLASESAPDAARPPHPAAKSSGIGFAGGLGIGVGIGIVIGFLIARRHTAHAARDKP